MRGASSRSVPRHFEALFHRGSAGSLNDEQLLRQFVAGSGEVAETAFAAIVERHGPMVLGVCRRVLGHRDAAEDAFQITFLVLARKAASLAHGKHLYRWLYGVAVRAALDARARESRQRANEKRVGAMQSRELAQPSDTNELRAMLDEELARLPERFRSALVLCELDGVSRREAAARLGISEGTLSSRLSRAKTKLKERLTRRGVTLSAAALASFLTQETRAVIVPPALVEQTVHAGARVAAGSSLAGVVSTSVITATQGVLKAMLMTKLKGASLGLVALAVVGSGLNALAQSNPAQQAAAAQPDDRLKSLEQKIDKLIETLAGTAATTPPQGHNQLIQMQTEIPANRPVISSTRPIRTDRPSLEQRVLGLERRFEEFDRRLGAVEAQLRRSAAATNLPAGTLVPGTIGNDPAIVPVSPVPAGR